MAKPRVFISSTFYDLKQIRSDIDSFIQNLGYESIRNEEGNIPYGKDKSLEDYCYKEIKSVDILISIIGGRYGSESKKNNNSISQVELETAHNENKQIYIFIENSVLSEYETFLLNKDKDVKYKYVDNVKIYEFIEKIKNLNTNNNIKGFDNASDITKYLKEQFAGRFKTFLEDQTRVKESNLIKNLEKTSNTLNQLVNFLSEENKEHTEGVQKILMTNHPLIEELSNKLSIKFKFFIEEYSDLKNLLESLDYKEVIQNNSDSNFYIWNCDECIEDFTNEIILELKISKKLFDENEKLRFMKKSDWKTDYLSFDKKDYFESEEEEEEDFPF